MEKALTRVFLGQRRLEQMCTSGAKSNGLLYHTPETMRGWMPVSWVWELLLVQNWWQQLGLLLTYQTTPTRMSSAALGRKWGTYDEDYSWRYTSYNNDCDCCGTIRPGEYSQSYRRKRQRDNPNVICTREENNNRRATAFREEGESNMMAETSNRLRNEALNLINQWDSHALDWTGQVQLDNIGQSSHWQPGTV